MLGIAMLSYYTPIGCLICAVFALEAIDNWEDWLGQRPVQWQWHTTEIILPLPLLEILGKLLSRFYLDLVFVAYMASYYTWTESLLAASNVADDHVELCIYLEPRPQSFGQ